MPPSPPPPRLLDANRFSELRAVMGSRFTIWVARYIDDTRQILAQMENFFRDGDTRGLHGAAHSLKSSSALIGAMRLSALAEKIERKTDPLDEKGDVPDGCENEIIRNMQDVFVLTAQAIKEEAGLQ